MRNRCEFIAVCTRRATSISSDATTTDIGWAAIISFAKDGPER